MERNCTQKSIYSFHLVLFISRRFVPLVQSRTLSTSPIKNVFADQAFFHVPLELDNKSPVPITLFSSLPQNKTRKKSNSHPSQISIGMCTPDSCLQTSCPSLSSSSMAAATSSLRSLTLTQSMLGSTRVWLYLCSRARFSAADWRFWNKKILVYYSSFSTVSAFIAL